MVGSVDQIEIAFEMFRRKPANEENLPLTVSEDPTGVEPVGYRTIDSEPEGDQPAASTGGLSGPEPEGTVDMEQ